jgi:hypothetical protein
MNLSLFVASASLRGDAVTEGKTLPGKNGRPEWIRTIDLFRVKEAL